MLNSRSNKTAVVRWPRRWCWLLGLFFAVVAPQHALAQTELIVRLDDTAPAELVGELEQGWLGKKSTPLYQHIQQIKPIFSAPPGAAKRPLPFRAYTLRLEDDADPDAVLAQWQLQPGVLYVQRNRRYRLDALQDDFNDPHLDSLSHLPVINVPAAWETTRGEASVRIGFIDTGVFLEHPDLRGQFWVNPGEDLNGNGLVDAADFNGIDDDGNGYVDDIRGYDFVDRSASVEPGDYFDRDPNPAEDNLNQGGRGHGTIVAGVLGAALDNGVGIAGVAPGSKLVPLRAFGADGLGEDDDVAAAIVYAAQQGIEVLNLSFGDVYFSPIMEEAIRYAVGQGTVVVASGGNLGGDDPHYPSDYPDVIGTAWLTSDGESIGGRGAFGVGIDLGAPGSAVYTTTLPFPEADPDEVTALYGRRSGSSLAAPQVAGAAALLKSVDPSLTPASIQSILAESARDIGDAGWDHRTGAGLLDVAQAVRRALPARVEITAPAHEGGISGTSVAVIGTVVHPSFDAFVLQFQPGAEVSEAAWQTISGPHASQVLDDTLGVWPTANLADGVYTLRLAATLRTGKTVEDRRRVYVDATAPDMTLEVADVGLVGDAWGLVAEIKTDDLTTLEMVVERGGTTARVASDRKARRHALFWADETGQGGRIDVRFIATNAAGLVSEIQRTFELPRNRTNHALFEPQRLDVPHGYLLSKPTDFDRDGLLEITFNQYQNGWIGDTLATYEWAGSRFQPAQKLVANVIPRDVGDADGDGLLELLTQVAGATLVLEQPSVQAGPTSVAFVDTTGLANPFDENAAFGSRIADLDADGRGEYLVHNTRQWRVLEYDGGDGFVERARLENPTAVTSEEISANEFSEPQSLVGDFDGDGKQELIVGDNDGDWIQYEAEGNDTFVTGWTYETDRYNAGSRFTSGDFDGDGRPEWVGYTQNWTQTTADNEQEAPIGIYYLWDSDGDNSFALMQALPVAGNLSRHGSLQALDVEGDGTDELVIAHPPHLYVLGWQGQRLELRYHTDRLGDAAKTGVRSIAMTVGDFDQDGQDELLLAGADGFFYRLVPQPNTIATPPPRWVHAAALDAETVLLRWNAAGADSVTVFQAEASSSFDPVMTTRADSLLLNRQTSLQYALQGWHRGSASPLSDVRTVRLHAPAVVASIRYPAPKTVELVFSEPIHPATRADQFWLEQSGPASALVLGQGGRSVALRFDELAQRDGVLHWENVVDQEGTPTATRSVAVTFPNEPGKPLFIANWALVTAYAARIEFSAPLDPAFATQTQNYELRPAGTVTQVEWNAADPASVIVHVEGRPLGATGQETTLLVRDMQGAAGETLGEEGRAVRLLAPAASLADAYVFPNPVRVATQREQVTIAGLPEEASLRIFSSTGLLVRQLEEFDGDGGTQWDLRDAAGERVPSGIYLVRIEASGEVAMRKVAVVR